MKAQHASVNVRVCATVALLVCAPCPGQAAKFEAEVAGIRGADLLLLKDGRKLRLQGVSLPAVSVRPETLVAEVRAYLRAALGRTRRVVVWPDTGKDPEDPADLVGEVTVDGKSINEGLLRRGLAVFSCRSDKARGLDRLAAAGRAAQKAGVGWFGRVQRPAGKPGFLNGAVLGLHYRNPDKDYHRQLDELAEAGFRHVCLLFSAFLQKVDSVRIDRFHERTVRDARLIETIRYAKKKGFTILVLPIVLLLDPGDDDWRGNLKPKDERRFFLNYDRFLSHYLDIAEATGVDMFSVGSEFSSLEDRREAWDRVIRNARGRFRGELTYSANWDHVRHARFLRQLDFIGMTAYFSLTKKRDPSQKELDAGWRKLVPQLAEISEFHGRPVVLTELGYASQDGINTDPWNYVMNKDDLDLEEQVQCFRAFLAAVPDMKFLRGAYLFDYFLDGGKDDWSYSPRGKPAWEEWKRWASWKR